MVDRDASGLDILDECGNPRVWELQGGSSYGFEYSSILGVYTSELKALTNGMADSFPLIRIY